MCDQHSTRVITIQRVIGVDPCIADEVLMLNGRGVRTVASCCGHGEVQGSIMIHANDATQARTLGYEPEPAEWADGQTMEIRPQLDRDYGWPANIRSDEQGDTT